MCGENSNTHVAHCKTSIMTKEVGIKHMESAPTSKINDGENKECKTIIHCTSLPVHSSQARSSVLFPQMRVQQQYLQWESRDRIREFKYLF